LIAQGGLKPPGLPFARRFCYTESMTLVFNFKHDVTEMDVHWAMATALFDELMEG
jgi:hypothetical protein